ncbi:MAG: anthranilate synthase component I family protein [Clostridiales bacterium]|nr:anthranilate synthase component I family protein [Clostridiales bacterium]
MIYPDYETFTKLQLEYSSVPIYTQFKEDYFTPIAIFEKLKLLKPTYLLESAGEHQENGRYSYIGLDSKYLKDHFTSIHSLEKHLTGYKNMTISVLPPFYNGFIGYLGYESIQALHPIEIKHQSEIPTLQLLFSKVTVIIDHFINEISIVYNADCLGDEYHVGVQAVKKIHNLIQNENILPKHHKFPGQLIISSNMTKNSYIEMVKKAQNYIAEGDIFQVVLSQKFTADYSSDPFEVYKSVRRENPSPYLSYIEFEDVITICSSPELLIKHQDSLIETAPIAGTRAVKNDGKDDQRAHELLNDEKELAEHLMLVDLGRNDVGRVSKPGSVHVESFCQIKKYAKVMHLVSSVKGILKEDENSISALISAFPAGTVSGAPKIRAMEIIDELEPDNRNLYAGSIFYINNNGNLNSCIAIRTIMIKDNQLTIQSGGGIVYDSKPEDEYLETLNKAGALFSALENLYEGGIHYDFNH